MSWAYTRYQTPNANRLASRLFFRVQENEQPVQPPFTRSGELALHEFRHDHFVPEYRQTKEDRELYLPLLEVLVEVEAVGTIAWTTLTQTFINRATSPVTEATYCFPLYDKSTVTSFSCFIGGERLLKGVVKPKAQAKAEFKAAVARQHVAALLEEHTPEVFETSIGNTPAQTAVKVEICYITELKADLSGDGILLTIPTSVAPRYGTPPSSLASSTAPKSLAVPLENGLQIRIQVSSPVAINRIESRTHPVTIEMGSHGHMTTKNIRDLAKARSSLEYDPTKARATLSDRTACLGKDFVLLIQSRGGTLLASRAVLEPHSKRSSHSALIVSINLRDIYTPNVVSLKPPSEIIFLADRSGSMEDKIEALKTAIGFFLKSLPNNCSFNICSFGSSHALMWPKSRYYNQASLDEAMSYITNFRADMRGTELLSGLRSVVEKADPVLSTQIITLMDGEVWNAAGIFEFIRDSKAARGKDLIRFFALGIGDAVSHHLIEGIGRNGGGLAEVVSVDSAGDWKSRVIRMLEAALTPSTWKVEINLGGFPKNEQEGLCIQALNRIPDFHAFSRSSVYFLLSEEAKFESVNIIANATSGETVTAELPVQILENTRNCVHLLAAKEVLNDFESGQSWLHGSVRSTEAKSEAEIEDCMRVEAERIGIEWSLSSRWTSFVVVDNNTSLEKTSRWYQAERSELADLTRPRYGSYGLNLPLKRSRPGSRPKGKRRPGRESIPGSDSPTHTFAAPPVSFGSSPESSSDWFTSNDKKSTSQISTTELGDQISQQSPPLYSSVKFAEDPDSNGPSFSRAREMAAELMFYMPSELPPGSRNKSLKSVRAASTAQQPSPQPKDATPSTDLSLENLVDAQTAEGSFKLNNELSSALKSKFRNWKWEMILIDLSEELLHEDLSAVLDTARTVVFIKTLYHHSHALWGLVVQKAHSFITSVFPNDKVAQRFWPILDKQLSNGRMGAMVALEKYQRRLELRVYSKRTRMVNLLLELDILLKMLRDVIKPYESRVQTARFKLQDLVPRLDKERIHGTPLPLEIPKIHGMTSEEAGGQIDSGTQIEDPDDWADGWDDILKLSQAIRLVMKEKGYPGY